MNRLPCTVARGRAQVWHQEFGVEEESPVVEQLERGQAYVRPEDIEIVAKAAGVEDARPGAAHQPAGPDRAGRAAGARAGRAGRGGDARSRQRELGLRGLEVLVRARAAKVFTDAA